MPIAFDASNYSAAVNITCTKSHTCTGTNLLLVAICAAQTGRTVSGITYNGSAMSLLGSHSLGGTSFDKFDFYYMINPPTGVHDVVSTLSSSGFNWLYIMSFTGVHQTSPFAPNNITTALTTGAQTLNCSIDTQVTGQRLLGAAHDGSSSVVLSSSTSTFEYNSANWGGLFYNSANEGASGTKTITVNAASSTRYGIVLAALNPVVDTAAPTKIPLRTLMGVGV